MRFIEYSQGQNWLFPPDLRGLIKDDDLCVLINASNYKKEGNRKRIGNVIEKKPG